MNSYLSMQDPALLNALPSIIAIDQQVSDGDVLRYCLRHTETFRQKALTERDSEGGYHRLLANRTQYCSLIAGRLPEFALLRLHEKAELLALMQNGISRERLFELEKSWIYDLIPDPFDDVFPRAHHEAVDREMTYIDELVAERPTSVELRYLLIAHPLHVALHDTASDRKRRFFPDNDINPAVLRQAMAYYESLGCDYELDEAGIVARLLV